VLLSDADHKALVFGLAMHERGRTSLAAGDVQVCLSCGVLCGVLGCGVLWCAVLRRAG
jgi:hypothetical protein